MDQLRRSRHHGLRLPGGDGHQLNFPDDDVACVTGEGSIQMNIQELSTCLQYDLPVKIVNLNNGALGMVRQWQGHAVQQPLSRIPTWNPCRTSVVLPKPTGMSACASPT
ncbi:thiamine pyrophosphate-dependent enzyme [Pseudomonas aeruginosa]